MLAVPDLAIIIQFSVATVILAITPGPDMTLFVGRALTEGRAAGFACFMGSACGILVHTLLVVVGLSTLLVASPKAFLVLKIVGAGYLIWLAIQAVRHGSAFSLERQSRRANSLLANWATGLGINLMNPKIILFYMTFLPQFVHANDPQAPGKLLFLGILSIGILLPVVLPMIVAADSFAALLTKQPRIARSIDWLCAGLFSAFAVKILMAQAK